MYPSIVKFYRFIRELLIVEYFIKVPAGRQYQHGDWIFEIVVVLTSFYIYKPLKSMLLFYRRVITWWLCGAEPSVGNW
jgi:hypothetical protein